MLWEGDMGVHVLGREGGRVQMGRGDVSECMYVHAAYTVPS